MAEFGRFYGSILAHTGSEVFLIGDLKQPAEFERYGLETPAERNVLQQPYIKLVQRAGFQLEGERWWIDQEGEKLAQILVDSFLIFRNGSVSERLWRLVKAQSTVKDDGRLDASWLAHMPPGIWDIVRDSVLRC